MKTRYFILILLLIIFSSCKRSQEELMEIYTRAQIEAEKGNLTEAINIIETGIKKNERDAAYYLFHGTYVYYQNPEENAQTALEEFKISYKSNQDNYINNMVIGMCYFTMKDYENAVSFYEKANSLYTEEQDAPPVYYELAESYFQNGQIEEALKINTLALEKDPNYSWNYMQRGIILSQDGSKSILFENYCKAIEKDSSELELHKEYIKRLIELKYYNDALEFCNELLEFNNSYDWCYSFLGLISMLDGNMDEGKNYLEIAFSINDKNIDTLSYLSFYYYFIKDHGKAWEFDFLAGVSRGFSIPLFETESEYILRYNDNVFFKLLLEKYN